MESEILVVGLAVLVFGMLAGRIGGTPLTMPMLFTSVGLVFGPGALGVLDLGVDSEVVSVLAEATLVVVLFTDASRLHLRTVLREHALALRLLLLGLPLAVLIGTGAGLLLLPTMSLVAVALLAATLAPTDAALGQSFVEDQTVPARIRQTLNVESGLNDGLAVPFVIILLDIALGETGSTAGYVVLLVQIVGVGVAVGVLSGWLGGLGLSWCVERGWTTDTTQRLATVSVAAIAYAGAELAGGNGFVSAYVAGIVIGFTARPLVARAGHFAEGEGQLLTLLTFLLFGAVMVGEIVAAFDVRYVLYALVSLLVVRPLAVAISLLGSGVGMRTVAFIGWAGPRGLASIVYAVLIASTTGVAHAEEILLVGGWTILLSVFLHGMTAARVSARYGAGMSSVHPSRPEHGHVSELPVRLPPHRGRAETGRHT